MPLTARNANVPDEVAMVIMRCLERDPALRYENGRQLAAALGVIRPSAFAAVSSGPVKRPPLVAPKAKRPAWAPFAAVAAGLAFAGWGGSTFAPSKADQFRARELRRFQQMDWKLVNADTLPQNCFGYQPCLDRREALTGSGGPAQAVR